VRCLHPKVNLLNEGEGTREKYHEGGLARRKKAEKNQARGICKEMMCNTSERNDCLKKVERNQTRCCRSGKGGESQNKGGKGVLVCVGFS